MFTLLCSFQLHEAAKTFLMMEMCTEQFKKLFWKLWKFYTLTYFVATELALVDMWLYNWFLNL